MHSRSFSNPIAATSYFLIVFILAFFASNVQLKAQQAQVSLFDGKTLKGWKIFPEDQNRWTIKDSVIIGGDGIQKVPVNLFLYTEDTYEDFEFHCLFKLTGDPSTGMINSGIQYRSFIKDNKMTGYQADIGNGYWGDIYDEHRRGELVKGSKYILKEILDENGWNSYIVRCKGNKHDIYVNGVKTATYVELDDDIPTRGVIAIQLHSGGNAKIEVKHITLTLL